MSLPILQLEPKQNYLIVQLFNFIVFRVNSFQQVIFVIQQLFDNSVIFLLVKLQGGVLMFDQGMFLFLQKLLIADGKAHPHLSVNQIDHFVILLEEQVLKDQEKLFFG